MDLADDEAASPPPRAAIRSRPSSWSSSGSSGGVEYTSLRDVLAEAGPGSGGGSFGDAGAPAIDFDASNINIRNQLLKHAASAYLQSAIVVPQRDPGCLSRLWRRMLHRRAAVAGLLRRRGPAVPLRRVRGGLGAPARRLPVRLRRSHLDVATRVAGSRLIGGEVRAGFVPEGYDCIDGWIDKTILRR